VESGEWGPDVENAMTEAEVRAIRRCVRRQAPFGSRDWLANAAKELGLEFSLNPQGRPRKKNMYVEKPPTPWKTAGQGAARAERREHLNGATSRANCTLGSALGHFRVHR
jgi:hypothetical protein